MNPQVSRYPLRGMELKQGGQQLGLCKTFAAAATALRGYASQAGAAEAAPKIQCIIEWDDQALYTLEIAPNDFVSGGRNLGQYAQETCGLQKMQADGIPGWESFKNQQQADRLQAILDNHMFND